MATGQNRSYESWSSVKVTPIIPLTCVSIGLNTRVGNNFLEENQGLFSSARTGETVISALAMIKHPLVIIGLCGI